MKGYSSEIPENCASARVEGTNTSHKDLIQVCAAIRNRKADWAVSFLEKVADGEVPVLYRSYNKKIGHRRELGGRKGRYPQKAAKAVLKLLQSAMANGRVAGLGEEFTILTASANTKEVYPRMAPKGRRVRSALRTSRIEIILKGSEAPKGVSVTAPKRQAVGSKAPGAPLSADNREPKKAEAKPETKTVNAAKPESGPKPEAAKPETAKPAAPPTNIMKEEAKAQHEHKHEAEKNLEHEKARPAKPHQHGENEKR